MKLNLLNTSRGLIPCYDDDFEEKKKLKVGQEYVAEVKLCRNPAFHRKYFSLIGLAWDYLPERTSKGFRSKEAFRKYVEVAAGYYEPFYSPTRREWIEVPRSISFGSMDEAEFSELYNRVKDVIFTIIGPYITEEEFEKNLTNY